MDPLHRDKEPVRQISDIIGDWGLWQANTAFFVITAAMFSAFNNLASAFYAPAGVAFQCDLVSGQDGRELEQAHKPFVSHETMRASSEYVLIEFVSEL